MKRNQNSYYWVSSFAALSVLALSALAGCLSAQNQANLGDGTPTDATGPFVEVFIEYPGPQEKWAGPSSFLLHVSAKEPGEARIAVTPDLRTDDEPTLKTREPAASKKPMPAEVAREQIAQLANVLQSAGAPFRGCLYPVRARFVRTDGSLIEKQGCRSEIGWSRSVSDATNFFLTSAVNGFELAKVEAAKDQTAAGWGMRAPAAAAPEGEPLEAEPITVDQ